MAILLGLALVYAGVVWLDWTTGRTSKRYRRR
jgi:hypothetical protein